jgi:hypothetical protein
MKIIARILMFNALIAGAASSQTSAAATTASAGKEAAFDVRQTVVLKEIPRGTRNVRLWISIPDDGPAQRVLNFSVVSAPGTWRVVRDRDQGNRFLYMEVANPDSDSLTNIVDFCIRRQAVFYGLDPVTAGALSESQQRFFAEELRPDAPHMEVTDVIRKLADDVCGQETNLVLQVSKLLDYVSTHTAHYSKDPSKPRCSVGDAGSCLVNGGGCCTDIHSFFIALARARGIPTRLQMGYRLQSQNAGVEADPGYRCWVEYFIPGYGWVPADIVEASAADAEGRVRWFSGLNERRVHLNEGREFELSPKQSGSRVNTMVIGYAEIDGVPARVLPEGDKKPQLTRIVIYTERTERHLLPLLRLNGN